MPSFLKLVQIHNFKIKRIFTTKYNVVLYINLYLVWHDFASSVNDKIYL